MTLDELKALEAAATPGPWRHGEVHEGCAWVGTGCDAWLGGIRMTTLDGYNFQVRQRDGQGDAALIVAMHTMLPRLIAVAEAVASIPEGYLIELREDADVDLQPLLAALEAP